MAQIRLQDIAHSYTGKTSRPEDFALQQLDLTWRDGGAYALLGPSGCGKTTLLNIISGLLVPSRGKILFNDQDVTQLTPEKRNIAQIFQFPVIYDTMTVFENLAFPLKNQGVHASEIASRVTELAAMLDLQPVLHRKAIHLTADAKQKISLGRGLIRKDVNAILFDEPLTVIDPQLKWQLRSQLKHLHQQFGHTMIYVTHDQTEALTFAEEVIVMYAGKVVQTGTPEALFQQPEHTFVGYFIGSPGMNILPCQLAGDQAVVAGHHLPLAANYQRYAGEKDIKLGVRPEHLRLTDSGSGLPVRTRRIDDIGRHRIGRFQLQDFAVNAILDEAPPGEQAWLTADPQYLHVYINDQRVPGELR